MVSKIDLLYVCVRFRMQVMLDGRRFPIAEASNKKVAKNYAAAATLKVLQKELGGGEEQEEEEEEEASAMDPAPDNLEEFAVSYREASRVPFDLCGVYKNV